jgi:uncharacterized protein YndB with AHSA1/START domain
MTTGNHSTETPSMQSASSPVGRELIITRIIDAPRELVFKAWTDPEQLAKWWGPKYFTNPLCELDLRPGGPILIHMAGPDGVIYPMKGMFQEIVAPERLVFSSSALEDEAGNAQMEALSTVTFEDQGGKTKLTLQEVVVRSTPAAEWALSGMEEGWNQSLDKLAEEVQGSKGDTTMGKTNFVIEPGKQEIVITRVFDAPRELVFKAFTDPTSLPQWWGPRNLTTIIDKMELRPGGVWRYVSHEADGTAYGFHGVYHDVVWPERLVQTFEFEGTPGHVSLDTATFEEQDGKTKLTAKSVFQSLADRDAMVQSGMQEGSSEGMDRLAELVEKA